MPEIGADEPLPLAVLEGYRAAGRAWVATVRDGGPAVRGEPERSGRSDVPLAEEGRAHPQQALPHRYLNLRERLKARLV